MTAKIIVTLTTVSLLVFLGCSKDKDTKDEENQYSYENIFIYQHVGKRNCTYLVEASNRVSHDDPDGNSYDISGELIDYNATTTKYCTDYGRTNNEHGCVEYDYGSGSYGSCVIGIDRTLR